MHIARKTMQDDEWPLGISSKVLGPCLTYRWVPGKVDGSKLRLAYGPYKYTAFFGLVLLAMQKDQLSAGLVFCLLDDSP